ncbi:MAG: bifunctional DNA-formamidopyrimidine glycosylase/DNA-(apurinic or apyrimidinic site) lyase [Candidatus Levybacteria bacterium]|nr:bifunctional DNA-formamidopyrimidine glycosylase/DNA-(apurinic or apyrimidinic site) lyase [Candidatus Levybacteria bacterium]
MPELPEVETIRLGLQKYIVGKTIEDVEVRLPKIFSGDKKSIVGAKITDVKRFGKGLVIDLDNDYSIAAHIKLTGQFVYRDSETSKLKLSPKVGLALPNKFTHVTFKLQETSNKRQEAYLYYNDIRQFGWIKVVKSDKLKEISFFKDLGPEPAVAKAMAGKAPLNLNKFSEIISQSNTAIKVLLLDQKKMSGIGNIYANDGLLDAQIDPRRKAKTLTKTEIKKLYNSLLKVLRKGLETGGASELNFVNALGQEGKYQRHFLAYAQDGKPCFRCKTIIKKVFLGGRGTYFCPVCQK